jgi:hypothetical protein
MNNGYLQKKANLKAKRSNILIKKGEKHQLFRDEAFITQFYNNDNKNESKIRTKVETCFTINFCHQLRRKKRSLKPSLSPMYVLISSVDLTLGSPPQ